MAEPLPLVSVVLPTYNRAATLPRAIASVLAQSYRELELIVVDDGSTDGTAGLVGAIGDPRLRYLPLPRNVGVSAARNAGIEAARGPLVAFQDSDDEWRLEKLQRMVTALRQRPGASLVTCGYICPQEFSQSYLSDAAPGSVVVLGESLVMSRLPPAPCWLARRETLSALGGFDREINCFEDWELAMRLSASGEVLLVNEILHLYEKTPGSLLTTRSNHIPSLLRILSRHRERLRRHPRSWDYYCNVLGQTYCSFGDARAGRRWILEALSVRPLSPRGLLNLGMSFAGRRAFSAYVGYGRKLRERHAVPFRVPAA